MQEDAVKDPLRCYSKLALSRKESPRKYTKSTNSDTVDPDILNPDNVKADVEKQLKPEYETSPKLNPDNLRRPLFNPNDLKKDFYGPYRNVEHAACQEYAPLIVRQKN